MKAIVNVNQAWGIGKEGELLTHIPEDMRFFRETTRGCVVIMGRKTLETFPGKKPLRGRVNIVITSDPAHIAGESLAAADAVITDESNEAQVRHFMQVLEQEGSTLLIVTSRTEDLLELLHSFDSDMEYVIGGEQVYRMLLPYCDICLVTKNDCTREADAFFPDLDQLGDWKEIHSSEIYTYEDIHYRFTVYERQK